MPGSTLGMTSVSKQVDFSVSRMDLNRGQSTGTRPVCEMDTGMGIGKVSEKVASLSSSTWIRLVLEAGGTTTTPRHMRTTTRRGSAASAETNVLAGQMLESQAGPAGRLGERG